MQILEFVGDRVIDLQRWLSTEDLGLMENKVEKWIRFTNTLSENGIFLGEKKDYLVWDWNGDMEKVTKRKGF